MSNAVNQAKSGTEQLRKSLDQLNDIQAEEADTIEQLRLQREKINQINANLDDADALYTSAKIIVNRISKPFITFISDLFD